MKTLIQGKNIKTTYGVDHKWKTIKNEKNEDITVYTGKPELTKKTEIDSWETIKEFDEKIDYNSKVNTMWSITMDNRVGYINLSENVVVGVTESITRVDLGAYVLRTDKILSEDILLKEECEEILICQIAAFNKMMIESNEKLLSYCKLHKLDPSNTDANELFKLVYPNGHYTIEDGKLIESGNMYLGVTSINGTITTNSNMDWMTVLNNTTSAIRSK